MKSSWVVPVLMFVMLMTLMLLLGGCASTNTLPKIVNVPVNVPVYCHPNLGPEPAYPDTQAALKAAPNIFVAAQLLLEGRVMRIQRDAEKSAAIKACAGPA